VAPPQLLTDDPGRAGTASPEIARLYGVRMLEVEETREGDKLHESKTKWLTGGDRLIGRPLYGDYFEFDPTFTPLLITNNRPKVSTGGLAMWRRLRVLPFDFVAQEQDGKLADRLIAEAEAILAWIVHGARKWYEHGMPKSETVKAASDEYREAEDRIRPFLSDATVEAGEVHRTKLFRAYQRWCEQAGETAMGARAFNAALRERGFDEVKDRVYGGLSLKPDWSS
jgi:putative DNA primase/helicase